MRMFFIRLAQRLMALTPYEIRNRRRVLPPSTLHPLNLVLAYYKARGGIRTIVQVGACDGADDPLVHFIKQEGARAFLIEPNPEAFALLQKSYAGVPNVTLIQTAIADKEGEAYLYRLRGGASQGTDVCYKLGLSSFDRMHLIRNGVKPEEIEQVSVPCRTLAGIVAEHGLSQIDLLLIDVEGYDGEVVRMALQMPVRPLCIECEHSHLPSKDRAPLFALLEAAGYQVGYDRWNLLALRQEVLEAWKNGKE